MKIIYSLITLFLLMFGLDANAQVTFSPAVFTAEDEITLTVDVTATPMAGQAEAYIWSFSNPTSGSGPQRDGTSNGSWTNSNASGKMTSAGTDKWSYKFTGTILFGLTPAELKEFGFLVKSKDGAKQTPDYKPFKFDPLVFTPTKLRIFPSIVDMDDVVSINFDRSLGANTDEQRMTASTATIKMFDEAGTKVGSDLTINVKKTGENIWAGSFLGTKSFTPAAGHQLAKFKYTFNGKVKDINGADMSVSTSESEVSYTKLK